MIELTSSSRPIESTADRQYAHLDRFVLEVDWKRLFRKKQSRVCDGSSSKLRHVIGMIEYVQSYDKNCKILISILPWIYTWINLDTFLVLTAVMQPSKHSVVFFAHRMMPFSPVSSLSSTYACRLRQMAPSQSQQPSWNCCSHHGPAPSDWALTSKSRRLQATHVPVNKDLLVIRPLPWCMFAGATFEDGGRRMVDNIRTTGQVVCHSI